MLLDCNRIIALVFVLFILYVPIATLLKGAFSGAGTPSGEIESTKKGQTAFVQLQNQITAFTKQMVFRKELITFNTDLTLTMSGINYIESTQGLLGKDDWLFFTNEESIEECMLIIDGEDVKEFGNIPAGETAQYTGKYSVSASKLGKSIPV